jgi:diadenosine tetraphosphate (Ap4A) HIT family hydrolase
MRSFFAALLLGVLCLRAQEAPPAPAPEQFMADYARLMLAGDREALIRLYSSDGTLVLGDGLDDFAAPEQIADIYRNQWTVPTAFAWRNLTYRRLHPEVVVVTGGFDWTSPEVPQGAHFNYSAVLALTDNKWRIRSETEFLGHDVGSALAPTSAREVAASRDPTGKAGCVFCEIVAGKRQQESVVYRDDRVVAFLSIGPRNPGHVLIVPAAHAENFLEVPAETMHAMTDLAKRLAEAIQHTDLKMEGFQLQMNTGKAAGQAVFHAHLHLIPRYVGELPQKTPEDRVGPEVLAPVAAKIRAALGAAEDGARKTEDSADKSALGATRSTFELPPINTEVPLERIKEICAHYGLHALWRKIEKDPPALPFKSDGCTGWFDDWQGVSLYPAGFLHDLKYWAGYPGEDVERLVADAELMIDVAQLLKSTTMAETMFHGVRVGGTEKFKTSFSWGFGRQAPK